MWSEIKYDKELNVTLSGGLNNGDYEWAENQ